MTVDIYVHLESIRALLLGKDIYICSSLDNEINMHHSCGGFTVCVWVCASGVAGGSQYTTSCEPPCGLAVLLGRPVPHQSREFIISNITQPFHTYMFWPHAVDRCPTRHSILACDAFCGPARSSSITLTNSQE